MHLQVAGATHNVSNLLQLICHTDPPPRICDFDREQIAAVFEARSWGRLVTALSALARLKLLTPARRKRSDTEAEPSDKRKKFEQQQEEPLEPQAGEQQQQQQDQGDDDPSKDWVQAHARLVSTNGECVSLLCHLLTDLVRQGSLLCGLATGCLLAVCTWQGPQDGSECAK